jgi:hypothetical protein
MKIKTLLTGLAAATLAVSVQAITIDFQSNGSNLSLGTSSVFSFTGGSVTAYASAGGGNLYAKSQGAGEIGLGLTSDPTGNNEVWGNYFIQIKATTAISQIGISSDTVNDIAYIYASGAYGSLGTFLFSTAADGVFAIPTAYQTGYFINVAEGPGGGNVLLASVTANTPSVPDGGSTLMLLGSALAGLSLIRRKLQA